MCEEKCFGITPLQNESNLNLWKFLNHKVEAQAKKILCAVPGTVQS